MSRKNYGWRPDTPDQRDFMYAVHHANEAAAVLPPVVSLRDKMPPVFDQGELGSCTANALAAAFGFLKPGFIGSRLQLYYGERAMEGDIGQDNGAQIRDGVSVLNKTGIGPESLWPYEIANFTKKPVSKELSEATHHKATIYSRLANRNDFRNCLAAGFPFVVGITIYESFESDEVAKTGVVPLPHKREKSLGGHAICVIGYNANHPAGDMYEIRNSWGDGWGDAGNFWLPAAYLENSNLADDAWTLRVITG